QRVRGADDLGAAPRTHEIAREERGQPHSAQPRRLHGALPLARRRERHVEVADEAPRLGALHLAVTQQVDQGRTPGHPATTRITASSEASTTAPNTSPVRPPTRVVRKRARASATASPATRPPSPTPPSASSATASATTSAVAAPTGPTAVANAAP